MKMESLKIEKNYWKFQSYGKSAFEQCSGFLRIADGDNALDVTAVHPDNYEQTEKLLHNEGFEKEDLRKKEKVQELKEKLKDLIPIETTLKQARTIENLHTLIKNNGQDFNLTAEQKQLASLLT